MFASRNTFLTRAGKGYVPGTVLTFTSSGTWTAPSGISNVDYLVIAGGGGGGAGTSGVVEGGGCCCSCVAANR